MPAALITKLETSVALSDDDRQSIALAAFKRRSVPARQDICRENEPSDGVIVVLDGFAARFRSLQSGKRQIVGYGLPGDLLDVADTTGANQTTYGVCALAPTTFARIPRADIAAMMAESARIARAMWNAQGEQMSIACEWLLNVGQRTAEQRIAHLFCEQYFRLRAIGQVRDGAFALPVTQRDLADSAGLTNVHVNRVLKGLRQDGLLTLENGVATILDLQRLLDRAEFDPRYLHLCHCA
ncbi:MAG: Crp/Fnr family transcriptional regulator [Beijerinckiaceae bacterium]